MMVLFYFNADLDNDFVGDYTQWASDLLDNDDIDLMIYSNSISLASDINIGTGNTSRRSYIWNRYWYEGFYLVRYLPSI